MMRFTHFVIIVGFAIVLMLIGANTYRLYSASTESVKKVPLSEKSRIKLLSCETFETSDRYFCIIEVDSAQYLTSGTGGIFPLFKSTKKKQVPEVKRNLIGSI